VREDCLLELSQARGWVEPKLLGKQPAEAVVRGQRLSRSSRPVEGEHELLARALAQRVARNERLELADDTLRTAESEVRLDPVLVRGEAELLQPVAFGARERLGGELRER
jgi:hypothetical protein